MGLRQYLSENKITVDAFAARIGVQPLAVYRYLNGTRRPRASVMTRIIEHTEGAVGPNDFYDLPAAGPPALAAPPERAPAVPVAVD